MKQVLTPVEEPYTSEVATILTSYPKQNGYLLKLFRVFANSERFLRKGMPNLLDKGSPLSLREREIVILRICANNHCEYEWGVHVAIFAAHANLTEKQIAATCNRNLDASLWSESEFNLLSALDEICDDGKISGETLEAFRTHWSKEQQIEIFALGGAYHTVSFVANNSNLTLEEFAARFPAT